MFKTETTENFKQLNWISNIIAKFDGAFAAGGCFKNVFNEEKVKDIDIFFPDKEHFEKAVIKANKEEIPFLYRNNNVCCFILNNIKLELNQKIFGEPKDILSQFDFTITKFALYKEHVPKDDGTWFWEDKVIFHEDFFEHLFFKRLVVDNKIPFPESTYERMIKYMRYGYFPCKETKVKIANELYNLNRDLQFSSAFYSKEGLD